MQEELWTGYNVGLDAFEYTTGGAPTPTPTPTPIKVDDTIVGITYSGTWTTSGTNAAYYNNTYKYSNTATSYAQYTFTGTSISWYGKKRNDFGKADVYIDGVLDSTVDLYNSTELFSPLVYTKTGLTNASHTIKLVARSDHNASSTGYYVGLDAFEYTN